MIFSFINSGRHCFMLFRPIQKANVKAFGKYAGGSETRGGLHPGAAPPEKLKFAKKK